MESIKRRDLVKGAAVAAVTTMGVASVAHADGAERAWDKECDVLVVGASSGGVFAAAKAAEDGASVILVEASSYLGGTALLSGGALHIFGAKTPEEHIARMPMCDKAMDTVLVNTFNEELMPFILESGAPCSDRYVLTPSAAAILGVEYWDAISYAPNPSGGIAFYDYLGEYIEDYDGEVLRNTRGTEIILDAEGKVAGVRAIGPDGAVDIRAKAVVLATGGFAADPELLNRYCGQWADMSQHRTFPFNDGTGLKMGLAAGASLSRGMGTFYGHTLFYPHVAPQSVEEFESMELIDSISTMSLSQVICPRGVVLNTFGERFADESLGDEILNQLLPAQPLGRAVVVCDSAMLQMYIQDVYSNEKYAGLVGEDLLNAMGVEFKKADTIDELAAQLSAWNVSPNVARTVNEYNAAIDAGTQASLRVPRSKDPSKICEAPFYAMQVVAGISHTYGGLKINEKAEVLGPCDVPIPGLYADGGVGGGVYYYNYGGSVALGATFGYIAGKSAAEYVLA